jgi:hypothetical protein
MSTAVPDFTRYADEVQQVFKDQHSYDDKSNKVKPLFDDFFRSVAAQVRQKTPFEAKAQALRTTIDIAECILTAGDSSLICHDTRNDLPHLSVSSTIRHILDMLLPEELAALQADGVIPEAIRDLRLHAEKYALDLDINDSIDRLWLEESDQEEDDPMAL